MTITAANSVLMLSIASVYPTPQQIQGFSADDVTDVDDLDVAEILMGVDGNLSAGFIFKEVKVGVTLQADSPSIQMFEDWYGAEVSAVDKFAATGTWSFPSLGAKYSLTKGFLMNYKPMPDAKKVLQPRKFSIVWQSMLPSPQ